MQAEADILKELQVHYQDQTYQLYQHQAAVKVQMETIDLEAEAAQAVAAGTQVDQAELEQQMKDIQAV